MLISRPQSARAEVIETEILQIVFDVEVLYFQNRECMLAEMLK